MTARDDAFIKSNNDAARKFFTKRAAKVPAHSLKIGDVIMPPAREVRLWMRRTLAERGLPESALHQTIVDIHDGSPDVRGPWLIITATESPLWSAGRTPFPLKFKVRPASLWVKVS